MFTLSLFGTASIEGPDGLLVAGRVTQGRQLALLSMLALAHGRTLSRDKLVGTLWPEASAERARPLLSDTVYVLRNALGSDALVSTGDALSLDPARVGSDVARFEDAVAQRRFEEAVGLYRGPLLDGFHLAGSVEFETWLDAERRRLDLLYAGALECLAGAAEAAGLTDAGVGWWRRRAAHDPHNGHVALRLMHALDAAGDRAGALQHARIHATLLREDFDADPDPELLAFAERLRRAEHAAPPPPVAAGVDGPQEPRVASAAAGAAALAQPPDRPGTAPPTPLLLPSSTRRPAHRRAAVIGLAGAVALVALALAVVNPFGRNTAAGPARSVAVLPFLNMSPDPAHTYFSDGLSEQIILALSRIDGLRVAARTSSFALRNRELDVRAIADTLDVHAVLEGSVLVNGDRLRVIAQLIDARTGYHIWSEQYDGRVSDAFALQDSVAYAIASALHLRLTDAGTRAASAAPSFEAYDLYLRGLYLRNSLSADALSQAAELFDRVIELEPGYAQAWAAKASVIAPQAYFRYTDRDRAVAELRMLVSRALELDPRAGEAHASLAVLRLFYEWDWPAAEAALRRATELNPNDAHAWHHLGNLHSVMGNLAAAVAARERAVQLDPLNARTRIVLCRDYQRAGNFEGAMEQARRAAQLDALNPLALGRAPSLPVGIAEVLWRQGREEEAVTEYVRLATLRNATPDEVDAMREGYASSGMPGFWKAWLAMDRRQSGASPDPFRMAITHVAAGDTAAALDWLDRAYAERNPALIYLHREPVLSGMSEHPRVRRVARAMRLPD